MKNERAHPSEIKFSINAKIDHLLGQSETEAGR